MGEKVANIEHSGNCDRITKNPKDSNYIMVMEYARQRNLQKLLDSKYKALDWTSK
ncbi:23914_t:CDS:2, partial [Cetraspora pellucida]